jgi:hypothetical protein
MIGMKVTLIRTDKKNVPHVTANTIERLMARVKTDTKQQTIQDLRRHLPMLVSLGWHFKDMHLLPRVYPAVELTKGVDGDLVFKNWNGLVLLTIGDIDDRETAEQVKTAAMALPSTLAAFRGSSGKTVKLLVRIASANGQVPTTEDEADRLYRVGYDFAVQVYGGLFHGRVVQQEALSRASFRMTLDEQPCYHPKATPLIVSDDINLSGLHNPSMDTVTQRNVSPQRKTDYDKYSDYEYLYRSAWEQVREKMGRRFDGDPHGDEAFLTELARMLRQFGFPEEEAVLHMRSHLWTRAEDVHIRAIVGSVYAEEDERKQKSDPMKIRRNQQQMIDFLESRYVFRFNTVMGYTEFRPNNTWVRPYQPMDERVLNQMAIECRLEGLDAWDKDVSRYVCSAYVPVYNPVDEYLSQCRGKWDGKDRIRELARRVPTKNPHWEDWFYIWFLGMVRQWRSTVYDRYGNQVAPLLISKQGWNKSTFIQSLLPPELQWGYTNQLDVSEKRQTLQAMSQFLLINLDEFNQISPTLQQGFLKNVITLPSVKVKRPYGKHVEPFPRLASFIGATNQTDVLTDPSGGRRFLGIELTAPIDVSRHPNYEQLFAQALDALDHHEPHFFNEEQTQEIIEANRLFQQQTPAEQYFNDCFELAKDERDGIFLTSSAIFAHLKKVAGADLRLSSLNHFGRILSNMPEIIRKRTKNGTEYLVKPRK